MVSKLLNKVLGRQNTKQQDELVDLAKQYTTEDHIISKEQIITKYQTDFQKGLTTEQAKQKLEEYGLNQLTPRKETHILIKFLKEVFLNIFNILLNVGAILCFAAFALQKNIEYIYLACVLLSVVLITSTATTYQNFSSGQKMKSFRDLLPPKVNVYRDGELNELEANKIIPGDILQIRAGDKVPADVLVLECSQDAKVDNSSITGESEPLRRLPELTNEEPLETANLMFFGTLLVQGNSRAMVIKTGDTTLLGRIAQLTAKTQTEDTPIGKEIHHFIKIISGIAVGLGVVFGITNYIISRELVDTLIFVIGIIVANVPEGLPATLTMSLTIASRRMSRKSVLIKNLESVETLGSTSVICSDKTGTLTINKMTVSHIYYDSKERVTDTHNPQKGDFSVDSLTFNHFMRCMVLCNKAVFNKDKIIIGDASESALLKFCNPNLTVPIQEFREKNKSVHSIPFNSKNKWQLSIHQTEDKNVLVLKGAPERVLQYCGSYLSDGKALPITENERKLIDAGLLNFAKMGERVLGFCELELDAEKFPLGFEFKGDSPDSANFPFSAEDKNFVFLGLTAMIDPPRPSVPQSVLKCQNAGIKVFMVTGDHPTTARAIATKVNILSAKEQVLDLNEIETPSLDDLENSSATGCVVTGKHIVTFTEDASDKDRQRFWNGVLRHEHIVFSRTSPQQKLLIVEACQKSNSIVAVTGDGVNDSPALKRADLGVAMGIAGTDVAKEAADMILMDDNFSSIVNGVEEGRVLFDNLKKSIAYTLSSNIPEIAPFLFKVLLGLPLPLKTVQIFTIDLGTDMLPAISMSHEKKESDIMSIPPRHPTEDHLVPKVLIGFSYLMIGVIQMCAAMFAYFMVLKYSGFTVGQLFALDYKNQFESCSLENKYISCGNSINLSNGHPCVFHPELMKKEANKYSVLNMECSTRKTLLSEANAAYVITIVVVQIADVIISKTRRNSVFSQGMGNMLMNIGIVFEVGLICLLTYTPFIADIFSFSSVKAKFWIIPLPFFMLIFTFDEVRKWLIRKDFEGWVKRNTYW